MGSFGVVTVDRYSEGSMVPVQHLLVAAGVRDSSI